MEQLPYHNKKQKVSEMEYEKNMEIGENLMNELYELAKNFTPLCNENGEKVVYFEVEEKDGVLQKIEFWDKRKDRKPDLYCLAGVELLRWTNWSPFFLKTYWPLYSFVDEETNREWLGTAVTLDILPWKIIGEPYDIPTLLEVVTKRVAEAKQEAYVYEKSIEPANALADILSQDHDKKAVKKRKTKK